MEITQEENKHKLQEVAFDISVSIESFARGISEAEADSKEAKSSAKKLIEKIDEYLESLKTEFKAGDIVASKVFSDGSFGLVRLNEVLANRLNSVDGFWYTKRDCDITEVSLGVFKKDTRHATPEEIAEYKAALQFHKHGRKPFEVKRGDVVYLKGYDKNIFLDSGNIYKKHNFIDGDVVLVKTAEEVNEWLGAEYE